MKKTSVNKFVAITIILVLLAIGFLGYLILTEKNILSSDSDSSSSVGSFFPFGGNDNTDDTNLQQGVDQNNVDVEVVFPRLRKLTNTPTAGAVAFQRGDDIIVRYVEKSTGHVYELPMSETVGTRLMNKTIPSIHDSIWESSGKSVILRYLEDAHTIKNYSVAVPDVLSSTSPVGVFLPDNIEEMHSSNNSNSILYLLEKDGVSHIIQSNFQNTNQEQLFSSAFTEWLLDWPTDSLVVATPKPSYNIEGHTYFVDIENNVLRKIFGNKPALLSKMSPYRKSALFSSTGENGHRFGVFDIEQSKELSIPLATNPDKCVWSALQENVAYCAVSLNFNSIGFPDTWYKGQLSFIDSDISTIQTKTLKRSTYSLSDDTTELIDAIKLFLDSSETYLYFFNKKDMSLWSYELKPKEDIQIENDTTVGDDDITVDDAASSTADAEVASSSIFDGE